MRLTLLTYRRLVNLGDYENESLECSCPVLDDDDPMLVAKELRFWTENMLLQNRADRLDEREAVKQREEERRRARELARDRASLERQAEDIAKRLALLGADPGDAGATQEDDDIPF